MNAGLDAVARVRDRIAPPIQHAAADFAAGGEGKPDLLGGAGHLNRAGVVLDPDGAPAPNVPVWLRRDDFPPRLKTESRSDSSFEFPQVVDGDWRVSAEMENAGVKCKLDQWIEVAGRSLEKSD